MNGNVRNAKHSDIDALADLLHSLFSQDIEFEPNKILQKQGLIKIVQNPQLGKVLVFEFDNRIIGMVILLFSISTALGGKVATLEDMVIKEEFRSIGYGKYLLEKALDFARYEGCLRITLLTDYNNDRAIAFYSGFGFVKSPMIPMRVIF
jgi:ribosomal protein S18 acetylase RimI-like enzyme